MILDSFQDTIAVISGAFTDSPLGLLETAFTERVGFGQAAELVEEGMVVDVIDPGIVEGFCDFGFVGGGGWEGGDQSFCAAEGWEGVDCVGTERLKEGRERGLDLERMVSVISWQILVRVRERWGLWFVTSGYVNL